ncbi:membrane protein insertase YidC [Streptomyces sp. NPDC049881]|uniref:membrane protein insertase YidC n=1 Tax=Streptomyces sp. NPDC049881 TaxID=3155778 RepID=UPI00344563B6
MNSILSPLYIAVSWIIIRFHSLYSLIFDENSGWAWGLSIVSLVVVVRICLIPLFVRQIKSTRNMQALQPQMKKIQERYKNDRQRQSEEMMKLYRETGTNPLASCLPILAQSPFFIALFQTLSHIANDQTVGVLTESQVTSARQATIFGAPIASRFLDGANDVAQLGASLGTVRTVTIIMIVLMSASQFFTQRQLMTKNVDLSAKTPFMNQQKMLMYVFPLMFAVFGINFPVGVLIYWLTTNVWSMGQQLYVIQRNPTPGSLAYKQRQERLRKKGKLQDPAAEADAKKAETERAPRTQPKRQTKARRQGAAGGQPPRNQAGQANQPRTPRTPDAPRLEKSTDQPAGDQSAEGRDQGAQQGQRQARKQQPAKKSPQGKNKSSAKSKK